MRGRKHSLRIVISLAALALTFHAAAQECSRLSVEDRAFLILPLNEPELGLSFCRFFAPPCSPGLSLCLGTASGTPGEKVDVEVRGHADVEVNGFGLGIGHDPARLEFLAAHPGSFLEALGGDVFFGAAAESSAGYATVFAGLDPSSPPVVVPPDSLLATLTYRILPGEAGRATLLNESLRFGDPPVASVYTTRGVSLLPALRHGSIAITSSAPDCDATANLAVGRAKGLPGDVVKVDLLGSSVCKVNGFGLALGYDPRRIRFREVTPGRFLLDHAGSQLFLFSDHTDADGIMTLFVAFDLTDPLTVPATALPEGTVLASLFYAISPDAEPGVVPIVNETLTFGDPPVANIYTTERLEIRPRLESGAIVVGPVAEPEERVKRVDPPAARFAASVAREPSPEGRADPEPGRFVLFPAGGGQPEMDIARSLWSTQEADPDIVVFRGAVESCEDAAGDGGSMCVRYDLTAVFASCLYPGIEGTDATMIGSLGRTVSGPGVEPATVRSRVLLLELPPAR